MLLSLIILFEVVMVGAFATAFFTKQELFWLLSTFLSGVLMIVSYNVEIIIENGIYNYPMPYLMGINLLFFALTILFGLFDIFDK